MPRWLAVTLCLVLTAVVMLAPASQRAKASTLAEVRAVNAAMDWNATYAPLEKRALVAGKLEAYWRSFVDRLPRLSPAEQKFVDQERNSGSSERLSALLRKPEFSLWYLFDRASFCQRVYARLAKGDAEPNFEGYYWTKTQACYRNYDEVRAHLKKAGLLSDDDSKFSIGMFGIWEAWTIDVAVGSALLPPPEGSKP